MITDNAHLLHLNTWHPVSNMQKRAITYLMQFDLHISYLKGCRNAAPDCLSRLFTDSSQVERLQNAPQPIREDDDFLFAVTTRAAAKYEQDKNKMVRDSG